MKINDPKSLVFVDNIDNEVGAVEVLASIKYVDSAIEYSWNSGKHKDEYTLQAGEGIFIEAPNTRQIVSIKYDEIGSEGYLYINENRGLGISGITTAIKSVSSTIINDYIGENFGPNSINGSVANYITGYVSNSINNSWQDNLGKYNYTNGPGIKIHYDNNGHEIDDSHYKAISIRISEGEKYLEVLPWERRDEDMGLHTKGIDEAISASTNAVITGNIYPLTGQINEISGKFTGFARNQTISDKINLNLQNFIKNSKGITVQNNNEHGNDGEDAGWLKLVFNDNSETNKYLSYKPEDANYRGGITLSGIDEAISSVRNEGIAIQPYQISTEDMIPSGDIYIKEVDDILEEPVTITYKKFYYDIPGYGFESIDAKHNRLIILDMEHLENGNTRIWADLPYDEDSGMIILGFNLQNNIPIKNLDHITFKVMTFVQNNGNKINIKNTIILKG